MKFKNIDTKTVIIIVLSVCLIFSFMLKQGNKIDYKKDEIEKLKLQNKSLLQKNDSLEAVNKNLDKELVLLLNKVNELNIEAKKTESEITKLKNRRNEIPSRVNDMSALVFTREFSAFIDKKKK